MQCSNRGVLLRLSAADVQYAQVHVVAEHPRQRREGLRLPRHLPDDTDQPGRRRHRLPVLLRRHRLLVAPQGRPEGDVHQDPARLQEPGRRGELAPLHRPAARPAQLATLRHVRYISDNLYFTVSLIEGGDTRALGHDINYELLLETLSA